MQGFERADRQLLDAEVLAGHLVPAGSMLAFLAVHRAEVFPDADYADVFARRGLGRRTFRFAPNRALAVPRFVTSPDEKLERDDELVQRRDWAAHGPQALAAERVAGPLQGPAHRVCSRDQAGVVLD
jgi:hypothetical protein